MARLDQQFNANEVPEREEFTPLPPGMYTAMIVASELKNTQPSEKSPNGGQMVVLELDIQDSEHSGRKLFERLNIKNDNPKTVDIAFRTLGEIVKAIGKTSIKDTEELHNKRLMVEVRVDPPTAYKDKKTGEMKEGKPQNSIKKYLPASGAVSTPKGAATPTVESKADQSAVPPWKRAKT